MVIISCSSRIPKALNKSISGIDIFFFIDTLNTFLVDIGEFVEGNSWVILKLVLYLPYMPSISCKI